MLADLNLRELPDDALIALGSAITGELRRREYYSVLHQREAVANHKAEGQTTDSSRKHSSLPAAIPAPALINVDYKKRLVYLPRLLEQDWSSLFPGSDTHLTDSYVYIHVDPRSKPIELKSLRVLLKGKPFYIGKGSGSRAWDLRRNQGHAKRLETIRGLGYSEDAIVQVLVDNLTEQQALVLEAKLIYFFGSIYDESTDGCLVNLADHIRPVFTQELEMWQPTNETPQIWRGPKAWQREIEMRRLEAADVPEKGKGRQSADASRWIRWQNTGVSQKLLPERSRQDGYTVAWIPPVGRGVFMDVVLLIKEFHQLRTSRHIQSIEPCEQAWRAWEGWTRRMLRYVERFRDHEEMPILPPPFLP